MKIFILLSRVPWPLEKGDKLRAYHQIRHLSLNHEVHLCCLSDRAVDPQAIRQLQSIVADVQVIRLKKIFIFWRMLRALFSSKPFQVHYFFQRAARRKVRHLLQTAQPNHIYCQLIRCAEYVKHLHEYQKTLDYMDALSSGLRRREQAAPFYLRPFIREEAKRTMAYENLIYDYFEGHTIISEQDRDLIYHPDRKKIAVIPNGVDTDYFRPVDGEKKYDLVFTGNMSYPPNVECALRLANEILPALNEIRPGVSLLIAGANPDAALLALRNPLITVSGWMDDIRLAYNASKIFIAPMRMGSGMQNKLLEAMSMSLPCITSSLASMGIPDSIRDTLIVAETNPELIQQTLHLLGQPSLREQLGKKGRTGVIDHFTWARTVGDLESVLFNCVKTNNV